MNASEKNSFEEQWRGAFENAENTPDPVVWARIETHLADAEANRYRRQLLLLRTRMAAGVALLLLALGGWAAWQYAGDTAPLAGQWPRRPVPHGDAPARTETDAADLAAHAPAAGRRPVTAPPSPHTRTNAPAGTGPLPNSGVPVASSRQPARPAHAGPAPQLRNGSPRAAHAGPAHGLARTAPAGHSRPTSQPRGAGRPGKTPAEGGSGTLAPPPAFSEASGADPTADAAWKENGPAPGQALNPGPDTDTRTELARLAGRNIRAAAAAKPVLKDLRWQMNQAFWNQLAASEAAREEKEAWKKSRWQVGAGFQPSAFDPNFKITDQAGAMGVSRNALADNRLASNFANAANTAQPDLNRLTRRGMSYAGGIQAEFSLSNRFSLEGGVQYTYNQSQLEVSQYLVRTNEWQVEPLFYELLEQDDVDPLSAVSLSQPSEKEAFVVAMNAAEAKVVDNTYRYVGFPMRVVYKLLNRRVRASVGAGLSADVFLRNRLSSSNGDVAAVEINRADNTVYRNVGMSGQVSVKLDYTFGGRYSLYVEPSFRRAVTSFTTTPALQSFPSWWGVGTGLQYRF